MNAGDELMPYFYARQLPLGFGGLILANFLCDAMQTLVSGVNSVTAVASQDVLEHGLLAPKSNASRLWTARILSLVLGIATTGVALGVAKLAESTGKNIVDLMPSFNMFLGPLASMFLIGMFVPRVTGRTVTPAVLVALAVAISWCYCRQLFGTPFDLSINLAVFVPCATSIILAWLLSLVFDGGGQHKGSQFTWRAVMQRPERTPSEATR